MMKLLIKPIILRRSKRTLDINGEPIIDLPPKNMIIH